MSRLDQELVSRGLSRSRTEAARLIEEGRVQVNGQVAHKAAKKVGPEAGIELRAATGEEFVSRAGHKLSGALNAFPAIDPSGLRCLDAGASTGGFTDVLLRRNADHVAAVDVGHGQLVDLIRNDPRVSVYEGMNVRYMSPSDIGGEVDLAVADLSFISLTKVMPALAAVTRPGGSLVLMVKPQFEVGREHVGKTGVVTSPELRRGAVEGVVSSANGQGLQLCGLARSPLPGQDGNVEFFLWLAQKHPEHPHEVFDAKMSEQVDYS